MGRAKAAKKAARKPKRSTVHEETAAMAAIGKALDGLDAHARSRVITWMTDRVDDLNHGYFFEEA